MTDKELLCIIGEIDDRFVSEATPVRKKKHAWIGWTAAACLVLVAGLLALPVLQGLQSNGRYKYTVTQQSEAGLVLRWEDMTLSERFIQMTMDQRDYRSRGLPVDKTLLGEKLGDGQAIGYDIYNDQTYHQTFEVYAIVGIEGGEVVAVAMDTQYFVFLEENRKAPATLGQLLENYRMEETISLLRFTDYGKRGDPHFALESDDEIWEILAECADAPLVEDPEFRVSGDRICFTVMSEALGVYKKVLYVTMDGYLKTNALDYGYVYHIGKEAAARIMGYARTYGQKVEEEPYYNFVAGTITQVGEDYILVSDAVLCRDPEDGITYKILTTDPQFSRWLNYYNLRVGALVYIEYRGEMTEDDVISGAFSICNAIIGDYTIMIPE